MSNKTTTRYMPSIGKSHRVGLLHTLCLSLLMLVLGSGMAWGQTDYSGVYYIANETNHTEAVNNRWYLVPASNPQASHYADAYFHNQYCTTNVSGGNYDYTDENYGDSEKPFITTYKTGQVDNSVWIITPDANEPSYYNIIHAFTKKYVVYEPPYQQQKYRKSVHLETLTTPGNNAKFIISGDKPGPINIQPKTVDTDIAAYIYLAVSGGNQGQYYGTPANDYYRKGLIGLWNAITNDGKWYLEQASVDAPTITYDETINKFVITAEMGATIYYTTDGTTPTTSTTTTGTTSVNIDQTEGLTVIKAIAKKDGDTFPSLITTYNLPQCAKPVITISGGNVNINCATGGATIHYTTNGDPATSSSTVYNGPFAKGSATTFRAIATKAGYVISNEATLLPPTEVSSSTQITDMSGRYILASNFTSSSSIGTSTNPFRGTIDGAVDGELIIRSLNYPLVAYADGATIKNVILDNINITSDKGNDNGNTGAICNEATGATRIYNCGVLATTGSTITGSGHVGSIVGSISGNTRVINCYSYATVNGGTYTAGIVGYNPVGTTQANVETAGMVMNCMFYGDITGSNISPVYGGTLIDNAGATGVNNYNYYRRNKYDKETDTYIDDVTFDNNMALADFHRSWPADAKYLTRFEYYRSILNSNKKLCTWWVNGTNGTAPSDADIEDVGIAKWVLDLSIAPYPILKKWGKYPSVINKDPNQRVNPSTKTWVNRGDATSHWGKDMAPDTEGQILGTVTVTIDNGRNPSSSKTPEGGFKITAMDTEYNDYCYGKIQLPYYNEIFGNPNGDTWEKKYGGNYTDKVVTGWDITGGSAATGNNYADRNSYSGRVYAQGGYFYVPKGVTSITITAHWADAVYVCNKDYSIDRVNVASGVAETQNSDAAKVAKYGSSFAPAGTLPSTFQGQSVYTTIQDAIKSSTLKALSTGKNVYDQAIVLIGNVQVRNHSYVVNLTGNNAKPFTLMSADLDFDNEPDNCLELQFRNDIDRPGVQPIRFDFLPVPELGLAIRTNKLAYAIGIMIPLGHFEITETAFMHTTQFEYDAAVTRTGKSPVIINGGEHEQFTKRKQAGTNQRDRTSYFLLGGNAWIHRFAPGAHPNTGDNPDIYLFPVNVIGGQVKELYLTGLYRPDLPKANTSVIGGAPRCYIDGGKFDIVAGAGYDKVSPGEDVIFKINHSLIGEFYGGGINGSNPINGDIEVTINNSRVDKYCGGPKVGNMTGHTVTTNATGTTFGVFYGGGNGGNSYYRQLQQDGDRPSNKIDTWDTYSDSGSTYRYNWNGFNPLNLIDGTAAQYDDDGTNKENKGFHAEYEFEVFNQSNGLVDQITQRGFIKWIQFGITTTGNVESTLENCKVLGNFYGGGNLASVSGDVTSILTNTQVDGSVFGAGYSAAIPTFQVHDKANKTFPSINDAGVITEGHIPYAPTVYEWTNDDNNGEATKTNPTYSKEVGGETKWYCYTWNSLENLGAVTGNVTLTVNGNTVADANGKVMKVDGSVYGGGEESAVDGNTEVTVEGGTIGTTGSGGAEYGNVYGGGKGKEDDVSAGLVRGSTNVSISGSPAILHNVYGGGAYGSVGTFSYDATTGFPTNWTTTDNKGKCTVSITGGTIGSNGDNNGMVFGSSRGLEGNPETNANVDKMAWVYDTDVTIGTSGATTGPRIKGSVYGGGENGHNFHDAKVTVHSGTIGIAEGSPITDNRETPEDESDDITYDGARYPNRGNVYGSGCGTDTYTGTGSNTYFNFNAGIVRGNTTVLIDGGHVVHNVYGGGAMGSVGTYTFADAAYHTAHPEVPVGKPILCAVGTGTCTVTVSGGKIGVAGAKMAGYGKGGPDDYGHVFGAGRGQMHDPTLYPNVETCAYFNKTVLTISGTAFLTGSAYGGSESGHVLGDTEVTISGGQIGCGKDAEEPFDDDVWAEDYTPTDDENLDCDSWPFESPFAPYDPFANATGNLDEYSNGESTEGGRLEASDGHTYYGNVFGGGSGSIPYFDTEEGISKYLSTAGTVEGNTTVTITGGHILTNVYGGCEATNVKGSATITMTGGTVGVPRTVAQIINHPLTGYIFGAGKGDQRIFFNKETNVDRAFVTVEGGRVYGSVYGGGEDGHVLQNVTLTIGKTGEDGPTIGTKGISYFDGNVFGGGRGFGGEALTAGNVGGSIDLKIYSGKILGSVYGGGRLASVGYGLYLVEEEIEEDGQTIKPYGVLRPDDKYDESYPNPSAEDASAYYNKGRGHITIDISGGTIGNDHEYIYNPTATQKAAIPNTTFDYQNHLQYTKGGNVFAAGMGRLYGLDGTSLLSLWPKLGKCKTTEITMTGGTVKSSIYGGAELGVVGKDRTGEGGTATVNIKGGTVGTKVVDKNDATKYYYFGSVFGGGKGSTEDVAGISEAGTTEGNVAVNLNEDVAQNKKGAVVNQVFGCNDMNGSPKGTVTVHIYATQNADKTQIANTSGDSPVTDAKRKGVYDVQAIYGGGNLAAYEPTDLTTGKTNVIIDGCGLTSIRQVYGGGNAASTPATNVEVNGTYEIFELFGGGNGFDKLPNGDPNPGANVGFYDYSAVESTYPTKDDRQKTDFISKYVYGSGKASVNIYGGTVHRVFGGSNTKGNVRMTAVTMLEDVESCEFCVDEAYGGGKSAPMDAEAKLLMACIPGLSAAYGGAEAADIMGDVTLNITNGTFDRVFGGNNLSGTISGSITVNIEEIGCKPVIIGELYGGGNQAGYSVYGYDSNKQPKETGTRLFNDPQVNVKSFTSIGDIYGGGYGETAKMVGNPTVNISVANGKFYDNDASVVAEGTKTPGNYPVPSHAKGKIGAINNVFGGGNAAPVKGNTNVNIGTEKEVYVVKNIETGESVVDYYTRKNDGTYAAATGTAVEGTTYYEKKNVIGADIRNNVYGGGNNAAVTGNTNVVIGERKVTE